ncbi:MAG: hypothetical protein MI700_11145, partial [Balneolales bacterium]|nr:hypothetical protein [Balneolales bacterium]
MRIIVITMGLFVLVNTAVLAQLPSGDDIMNAWVSDKKFRVKPAMTFGWGAPQQWTAETSLYLGIFEKEGNPYIPNLISRTYKGICVTGAASFGGYKGAIKFFDFTAFNGPGGYQIGAAYYYN